MKPPQTHKGSRFYVEWLRGVLICNSSFSLATRDEGLLTIFINEISLHKALKTREREISPTNVHLIHPT
jgi:hypothetical protein